MQNIDNVKRSIHDCGVAYIGFNVPRTSCRRTKNRSRSGMSIPRADNSIVGGHAVVLAGYDAKGAR